MGNDFRYDRAAIMRQAWANYRQIKGAQERKRAKGLCTPDQSHREILARALKLAWTYAKAEREINQRAAIETPEEREITRLENKTRWSPGDRGRLVTLKSAINNTQPIAA
ncbi:MAG: hypothetical protein AAGI03_02755 [Pseudomonadota bacterium]